MSLFRVARGPDGRVRIDLNRKTTTGSIASLYVAAKGAGGNLEYKTLYFDFLEAGNSSPNWQRVTGLVRPGKFRKRR